MPETAAWRVDRVEFVRPTDDGGHLLISMKQDSGAELVVALSAEQILPLVHFLAVGVEQIREARNTQDNKRKLIPVTSFVTGVDLMSNEMMLSLMLDAGGRLDFLLREPVPLQLLQQLQTRADEPEPDSSKKLPN